VTQPSARVGEPFETLLARLAPSREEAGQTYERLRQRLIRLFEGRRVLDPESAADETLDRLARRLAEGVAVNEPAAYVLGIARMVALERDRRGRRTVPLDHDHATPAIASDTDTSERSTCLDRCLAGLLPDSRRALLEYYAGDGRERIEARRRLATRLAVSPTALRLRMFRSRADLESCVRGCLDRRTGRPGNVGPVPDTPDGKERAE
jgi:DNA-directed RNA polymerase specialized sigma24 family protein